MSLALRGFLRARAAAAEDLAASRRAAGAFFSTDTEGTGGEAPAAPPTDDVADDTAGPSEGEADLAADESSVEDPTANYKFGPEYFLLKKLRFSYLFHRLYERVPDPPAKSS